MLSVMVLGAGAAFSDQADIENTEAVDACSALNIIGGYEDGSFHPERNIKRSEITKMICVALNGGSEPNVSTNAVPTFSDVRGTSAEWAEGYIEACVAQGIVSGVGGGRFNPDGNVTGAQLAKMLLVALGYNAETENFTGNAWETNVNVRAAQKSLYDGLEDMDTSAAVTRDQAAQMVWNAMQAYEVEYKTNLVTDANGNLSTQIVVQDKVVANTNDKISLLRDKYDALVSIGTLVGIDKTDLDIRMSAADALASDDPDVENFSKLSKDYSSLLGQKVTVIYTANKSDQVLGVFATGDNTVYNVIANQTSEDDDKLSFGGSTYSVEPDGLDTYVNGQPTGRVTTLAQLDDNMLNPNAYTIVDSNGNGRLDTLVVKTYDVAQVTFASSEKIIANSVTYKYADENIADGIAVDDWIVITWNAYNDNWDVVKADVQTGTLDALRDSNTNEAVYFDINGTTANADYNEYQIGGTWYNGGEWSNGGASAVQSNRSENDLNAVKAGDTVDYVAVNGIMFSIAKSTGENVGRVDNAALIVATDNTGVADRAKIALFDGTTKTVDVDTTSSNALKLSELQAGDVYEYSVSGDKYTFEALEDGVDDDKYESYYGDLTYVGDQTVGTDVTAVDMEANDTFRASDGTNYTIDDNAQVLLFSDDTSAANQNSVKSLTGKQFKALNLADMMGDGNGVTLLGGSTAFGFYGSMNGLDRIGALAVQVTNDIDLGDMGNRTWSNYAMIVSDAKFVVQLKTVEYDIWTGTELITVQEDHNRLADRTANTAIGYDELDELASVSARASGNATHQIKGVDVLRAANNGDLTFTAVTGVSKDGKTVQFANGAELDVSGATILYINSVDKEGLATGSISVANKNAAGQYMANALYSISADDDAELLIVDQGEYLKSATYEDDVVPDGNVVYGGTTATEPDPGPTEGDDQVVNGATATIDTQVNLSGNIVATLTLDRADFMAANASVAVDYEIYVNGVYNEAGDVQVAANKSEARITTTGGNYADVAASDIEIKVTEVTPAAVKVLYKDANNNDISGMLKEGYTSTLSTSSEADIKFTVNTTDSTSKIKYSVAGLSADIAEGEVIANTPVTIAKQYAAGDEAVVVTITGLDALVENYTVTSKVTAVKLSELGVTGTNDKDLTLAIKSNLDTVPAGNSTVLSAKLSGAPQDADSYTVTLKIDGTDYTVTLTDNNETAFDKVLTPTKNVEITDSMVTVSTNAKFDFVKDTDGNLTVTSTGNTYQITFTQDIKLASNKGASDFVDSNNVAAQQATVDGSVLTLLMKTAIKDGESIIFSNGVVQAKDDNAELPGITGKSAVLTYKDSKWTVAYKTPLTTATTSATLVPAYPAADGAAPAATTLSLTETQLEGKIVWETPDYDSAFGSAWVSGDTVTGTLTVNVKSADEGTHILLATALTADSKGAGIAISDETLTNGVLTATVTYTKA